MGGRETNARKSCRDRGSKCPKPQFLHPRGLTHTQKKTPKRVDNTTTHQKLYSWETKSQNNPHNGGRPDLKAGPVPPQFEQKQNRDSSSRSFLVRQRASFVSGFTGVAWWRVMHPSAPAIANFSLWVPFC